MYILFGIMTVTLNIFIIKFYWKRELTIVPLLYTLIASFDIICAIGVIYKYIAVLFLFEDYFTEPLYVIFRRFHTLDIHTMIFCFLIQVSYRCSVFCNLVLAVSRTIMILKPFYQINLKMVKLACILYAVPWIVLNGVNIHKFRDFYFFIIYCGGFRVGVGVSEEDMLYHLDHRDEYDHSLFNEDGGIRMQELYSMSFIIMILPGLIAFIFPVIIVIITCIIQVISVWRSSQFPNGSNQRHVTITVLLMSTLFVVCNSVHSGYLATLIAAFVIGDTELEFSLTSGSNYGVITLLSATLFPMLNAALNPVIIITRSSGLRKSFLDFLQRILRSVERREY